MGDQIRISKYLSYILRHQPSKGGVTLDQQGWTSIKSLLAGAKANGRELTREMVLEVVRTNDKKRFEVSGDGKRIRAVQGHSVEVGLRYEKVEPPEFLWHGTATRFLNTIWKDGLKPMSRTHVHLSADRETAHKVGQRHGKPVIFKVLAGRMWQSGFHFYLAPNGVWLTEEVPALS